VAARKIVPKACRAASPPAQAVPTAAPVNTQDTNSEALLSG
jgi:hypothetical protein